MQPLAGDPAPADHLVIQYADGRQLSLVVSLAHLRPGLPPGAQPLLDRTGQLATPWAPASLTASPAQQHEWAFLAWWALGDVDKHARRGQLWRALASLDEARSLSWKLHAASLHVDYPSFGAVSVENAGQGAPAGFDRSLPARPDRALILAAATGLSSVLSIMTGDLDVDGIAQLTINRLAER